MRFVVLVILIGCAGGDERGTLESVPKAAAQALRTRSGGVALNKVDREVEGGVEMWEATWFENGRKHEAKVNAAGVVVEHEVEVPEAEVPPAVRATAETAVGKGAQFVRHMTGNYEAELVVGGKEKEVMIAPDGTIVGGDGDDDDDGDDD